MVGRRKFSLSGRIGARMSWKRYVRHNLGLKFGRGGGWITDPRRAIYSRIYSRFTFRPSDILKMIVGGIKKRATSGLSPRSKKAPLRKTGGIRRRKSTAQKRTRVGGLPVQKGLSPAESVRKSWAVRKRKYGPRGRRSTGGFAAAGRAQRGRRKRR